MIPAGTTPMNEFQTEGLATQAFPTLFPYGKGDPTCKGRHHPVTLADAFKHLMKYCDTSPDGAARWRFASHPRFPYWALNMKQRHTLLSQSKIYMQQNSSDSNLTIEELRTMVGTMNSVQLMKRLNRYAAKTQGSRQYWYARYLDLKALLEQKGSPTFFFTFSSADNYWPELHSLMPHQPNITHSARVQFVIRNPHITDWYFHSKLTDFIEHWLHQTLDAEWHWFRYEYQARGSTHAHGCAKLRNDPGLCKLVAAAALGWQEEMLAMEVPNQHIITYGIQAKHAAIKYVDWLVTTLNTCIPDETWRLPSPHPCTQKFDDMPQPEADYQSLVNCVQRHTRCSASYCLRKKNNQEPACRFGYPMECTPATSISFEELTNGQIRATLTTARNDPRLNSHNHLMLQHWRANVDAQIVVDVHACARYMTKYIAKSEIKSKSAADTFAESISPSNTTSTALRKCMIKAVGERDFSAQETAHLLLSLPLYQCTYTFVTLSLDGGNLITTNSNTCDSGNTVVNPSMLDMYSQRANFNPNILDLNLLSFTATFSVHNNEVKRRSHPVIVKTFPSYSADPKGPNYSVYCKYQLIKLKPWQSSPENAWDNNDNYISVYHDFLRTEYAHTNVADYSADLERAEQYVANEEDTMEDNYEYQSTNSHEEWMLLCQLNPTYQQESQQTDNIDWEAAARELPQTLLDSCPNWVNTMKQQYTNLSSTRQFSPINIANLNTKQLRAYNIVKTHFTSIGTRPPLLMLVLGTAGTGKSFLIRAMAQLLGNQCILTATTGIAGFLIGGITSHSALQLPVQAQNKRELSGTSLTQLQHRLKDVQYIIVDEVSMLGQRTMEWVDKRLKQASGYHDTPFGGYSLILIGDFAQLPPVGDRALFISPTDTESHGYFLYRLFQTVVILDEMVRQEGTENTNFRNLLMRLRDGCSTKQDWMDILARTPSNATNTKDFADATHLFYTKEDVTKFNIQKLHQLSSPKACINAIHSCSSAASAKADDASGLEPTIHLATGAKVMLTRNIWQQAGLCNGATGTVESILYAEGHRPPNLPIAVLVTFSDYSGPPFLPAKPKCIPVTPFTFEWYNNHSKRLSRQQIPLRLSYAITIHKSQGQTLKKAVIDIGHRERAAGTTFVAISRLKSLQDGLFQPMPYERLENIGKLKSLQKRIAEEQRLRQIAM